MERTTQELVSAISQMREFAAAYKGKRQAFFNDLYRLLATPIPAGENHNENVKRMYLAAIGALTSEIQPATAETYDEVLKRLNSTIRHGELQEINIATEIYFPDDSVYRTVDRDIERSGNSFGADEKTSRSNGYLRDMLPKKRRLSKSNQALVDKFCADIPDIERPFRWNGVQRG